jgi:hypothetical protein
LAVFGTAVTSVCLSCGGVDDVLVHRVLQVDAAGAGGASGGGSVVDVFVRPLVDAVARLLTLPYKKPMAAVVLAVCGLLRSIVVDYPVVRCVGLRVDSSAVLVYA